MVPLLLPFAPAAPGASRGRPTAPCATACASVAAGRRAPLPCAAASRALATAPMDSPTAAVSTLQSWLYAGLPERRIMCRAWQLRASDNAHSALLAIDARIDPAPSAASRSPHADYACVNFLSGEQWRIKNCECSCVYMLPVPCGPQAAQQPIGGPVRPLRSHVEAGNLRTRAKHCAPSLPTRTVPHLPSLLPCPPLTCAGYDAGRFCNKHWTEHCSRC